MYTCLLKPGAEIGFEQSTYAVNEDGGSVEVCVRSSLELARSVMVVLTPFNITAEGKITKLHYKTVMQLFIFVDLGGIDYESFEPRMFQFSRRNQSRCLSIAVHNDAILEDNETFGLSLEPLAERIVVNTSEVTIIDDDSELHTCSLRFLCNIFCLL